MLRRGGACGPAVCLSRLGLPPAPAASSVYRVDASRADNLRLRSRHPVSRGGAEAAGGDLADVELLSDRSRLASLLHYPLALALLDNPLCLGKHMHLGGSDREMNRVRAQLLVLSGVMSIRSVHLSSAHSHTHLEMLTQTARGNSNSRAVVTTSYWS